MGDKIRPEQMEVSTGVSNNDTVPTLGKVEDMISVEDLWDRDTVGTPFLKPANAGDDIGDTLIRINKIWATDIESTNYPSVSGTPLSDQYLATSDDVRFGQVIVDNLTLNGSTLSSSTGNNINITPDNPADHIIINSHWDFDGKTLVAISDSDTTLTAYTGKNITIESVTFDGGVVAAVTDLTVDNLNLDGNTLITTSGNMLLTSAAHITLTTPENNSIYLTPSGTFGMVRINSLTLSGDTISSDFSNDLNLISEAAIVLTSADNNDITLTAGLNGKVAIDNVRIYSSTIETSGGDLRLISASNTLLIGNSAAGVDYRLGFDGENNNGYIRWWEDEAYFDFDHYIAQPGVFASIYVTGGSAAQEIATGASYVKTTAFTTNGENSNCTSDQTNNKITITKTGKYRVVGRCCALSEFANVVWEGVAFLDGVAKTNLHFKQKLTTNTDVNNMGFNDLIDVPSVPVDLDLRVRHDSGGGVEITMEYATLNVEYVGST